MDNSPLNADSEYLFNIFFSFILDMNLQVVYMPSLKCDCSDYYLFTLNSRRDGLHLMANFGIISP